MEWTIRTWQASLGSSSDHNWHAFLEQVVAYSELVVSPCLGPDKRRINRKLEIWPKNHMSGYPTKQELMR
jgi:hypothetical protein